MKYIKKIFKFTLYITIISFVIMLISNAIVEKTTKNKIYDDCKNIPHNKVGLFLGTSKYLARGYINLYYKYRIEATVKLFKEGKIDYILVSGDNSTKHYDEPTVIKNDLVSLGIPEQKIYLDYAGFRTLDSVVRSKEIFGQTSITVISQKFHNQRAIYIASKKGIKAIGFNAKDVSAYYGAKTRFREKFARVKMMLDLIFGKKPKFLGKKIEIK